MARGLNGTANGSSQWHGNERGVEARKPGDESNLPPKVIDALPAVIGVHATIPENRRSAQSLGSEREGHGIVIDDDGLIVTIGYLIMEAETIIVTDSEGRAFPASIIGGTHALIVLQAPVRLTSSTSFHSPSSISQARPAAMIPALAPSMPATYAPTPKNALWPSVTMPP